MLEPEQRTTIYQHIGGVLYDFIDDYYVNMSDGKQRSLLSFIRTETHMGDPTLQRVFRGLTDSISQYVRIICAIQFWVTEKDFSTLFYNLEKVNYEFFDNEGDRFLEEQRLRNKPKRKGKRLRD